MLTKAQQLAMQTMRDKIKAFQEWKQEQEKSAKGEDCDEDEGFNDGVKDNDRGVDKEVNEEVKEVDEGFKDKMSKEVKQMRQIQWEVLRFCIALLDHPL